MALPPATKPNPTKSPPRKKVSQPITRSTAKPDPQDQTVDSPDLTEAGGGKQRTADFAGFLRPPEAKEELGRLAHYRILEVLGEGGMGLVFRAEDTMLRRPVALKVIKPEFSSRPGAKDRFLREAQSLAKVDHQHVIPIHQVGEDQGVLFLAMPLLVGETLEQRMKRKPPLGLSAILRIARQAAQGLAAAHDLDLVHRDIKPGNIWVEAKTDGSPGFRSVKILDFGLARLQDGEDRLTRSGTVLGTAAFMSPEQAAGSPVDARADLWSLGVVLYAMLAGKNPFSRGDMLSTLSAVAVDEPEPLRELNPKIPRALSDLVMRLLAKSPDERPQSAAEVAQKLERIEAAVQPKKAATRRTWPIVVGAALVGCVLLGIGAFVMTRKEPTQKTEQPLIAQKTEQSPTEKKKKESPKSKSDVKSASKFPAGENIAPEQAMDRVGSDVTVSFPVKSVRKTMKGGWLMLNSKTDFNDPKNLKIAIKKGADRMAEFGVDDDSIDRVVQVRGIVVVYQETPEIVITEPAELVWLTPKNPAAKSSATKSPAKKMPPGERVTVEQAQELVGQDVTVSFSVKSVGESKTGGWFNLNSTAEYTDPKNFAIAIKNGVGRKAEFGIDGDVTGRVVEVRGVVADYQGRRQIVVTAPTQLKWLPK